MQKIVVNDKYDDKTLSNFLLDNFNGLKVDTFYKALRKKDIRVNDVKISKNIKLKVGDEVKVFITDNLLYKSLKIDIIYEDENILIVNKPADIEVVGKDSLTNNLKNTMKFNFLKPCHRIDRNTTGLVLFAKNEEALKILLSKFKNKEIEKHYMAKVYGILKDKSQTLESYLFKDNKKSLVYISDTPKKGYVKIITSYTVLEKNEKENYSILDIILHTGKTHQIRAHLAHIGHPILGDGKYGINSINKKFRI